RPQAAPAGTVRRAAAGRGGAGVRDRRPVPRPGRGAALPARAERRPAAAGRLCPGPGAAPETDPGRRAGVHARRVDPDRAAQPDDPAARRGRGLHPLHHPRHRQRAVRGRPADRHVRRADRRIWASGGRAGQPAAPVYPAAAARGARPARPAGRDRGNRPRRAAQGHRPGPGLPVPLALPAGHRRVPPGHPGTGRAGPAARGRLPRGPGRRGSAGVRMKVAVIGGGSTYTPERVDGIARLTQTSLVSELVLVDPDEGRRAVVGPVSARIMRAYGHPAAVSWTADLDEGPDGRGAVLLQLRVGGQAARQRDETWPLDCGCVGQETTGAGGLAKALRTVPVVLEIAERTARRADPAAWIIDFTNPVGIVTRALLDAGHRAVGLCNVAIGFQRHFAALLGAEPGQVALDHVGLNHLTWERAA